MHTPPVITLLFKCIGAIKQKAPDKSARGFSYIFLLLYIITVLPGINISFACRMTSYKISSPICCDQFSLLICRGQRYNNFHQLINSQRKQNRKSYRNEFIFSGNQFGRHRYDNPIKRESRINRQSIRETQNTPVALKRPKRCCVCSHKLRLVHQQFVECTPSAS
jgi:hypothetical protein